MLRQLPIPHEEDQPDDESSRPARVAVLLILSAIFVPAVLWSYWPTLQGMEDRWSRDPQYSHGFLVPVFALLILIFRWHLRPQKPLGPNGWGVALLIQAVVMRLAGAYLFLDLLEGLSLPVLLCGLTLLLLGWPALRWAWPALAFLAFMLPLPFQLEVALAQPLRQIGTIATTYVLQVLGFPALAEGNVILIDELKLGVIDACNGLGMLMTFFALATAGALIVHRPLFDRLVLVLSAIPIALVANVVRITATAIAHHYWGTAVANAVMHDLAGWLMMPLALLLLWLELKYLSWLLVSDLAARPLRVGLERGAAPPKVKKGAGPLRVLPQPLETVKAHPA